MSSRIATSSRPFPDSRQETPADAGRPAADAAEAVRTARPAAPRARTHAHAHARSKVAGTGMITVIPYLTVVVCVVAGVYISWHQGSRGGGMGGVIAGGAFLVAAIIRLMLPEKLAGFLASRNRATDVVTLAAFGTCLLVVGLLLPR